MRLHVTIAALLPLAAHTVAAQSLTKRDSTWRADVQVFAQELTSKHKNAFAYGDRTTFTRAVAALDSAIPQLSDAQVQLRIARLAAMVRDGHTNAPLPNYALRLPLAVLWSSDGPHIVNATDDHRALIGARVTRVNGIDIHTVADSIRQYLSHENELGFWARAGSMLLRPAALRDAGIGIDSAATTLELVQQESTTTVTVAGVPARGFTLPTRGELPLYRQRAGVKYWWTYVSSDRTIFVKYNQCVDLDDFKRLADSVARAIDAEKPLRVVVDIRDNSGGNSEVVQPLIDALRGRREINRPDVLYVIMGRVTFSSGLLAAYDFRRKTKATLIGEPTGERPNSYGEVKNFKLPSSGLQISYSTKYFKLVGGEPESYAPDVLVPPTAEAYINGRDPAMEWILSRPRNQP